MSQAHTEEEPPEHIKADIQADDSAKLPLPPNNERLRRLQPMWSLMYKGIPRQGYEIVDENEQTLGTVTSGTMSPSMKIAVGLGYVNVPNHKLDSEIYIRVRKKLLKARVVKLPFYKK